MESAPIKLNPLGPHYYADLPRGHQAGLPDLVEDAMNNLTQHPFNPSTHGGHYVPRKAYVTPHVQVATLVWDDEHGGTGWPDYDISLLHPTEGDWYNARMVNDWDF